MQNLSTIKQLLADAGLRPKKRFGQNFLHDHRKMQQIMQAADVQPQRVVLEVGPGTGTLTEALVEAGAHVVAVEVDRDLEPILRHRLGDKPVTLVMGDVLAGKHDLNPQVLVAVDAAKTQARQAAFSLVANLPYNVASPLLVNLVVQRMDMDRAVVMVQREVADRLAAGPGGKQYGPLGIMVQAMCHISRVTTLPPGCFWPPPGVESAVVLLKRRAEPLTTDPQALAELLRRLFTQRRKQLGRILGRDVPLPQGVTPTMRPEQLSIEQLVAMAEHR